MGRSLIFVFHLVSPTCSFVRVLAEGLSHCARSVGRSLDERNMVRCCLQGTECRHHFVGWIAPVDEVRVRQFERK
ncbi:hypothetical protein BKN37_18420 [Mycobacterium talmoniae]|uniref:Uncharacterized protein n=1 Tax=Mycobacterium talmoniae TaxID=1858794 RepID=A0A1S1NJ17_9MYCO|nr:hypothetical protein BKN37_18420 [Mycobacterium talmoniae]